MNVFKTIDDFEKAEKSLPLSKKLKSRIREQLSKFDNEFSDSDDNSLIILERGERLHELFKAYPHLEKVRAENSSSIDNYINEVFVTSDDGAGVSVYLPIDPPVRKSSNQAVSEYYDKYLGGGGPSL